MTRWPVATSRARPSPARWMRPCWPRSSVARASISPTRAWPSRWTTTSDRGRDHEPGHQRAGAASVTLVLRTRAELRAALAGVPRPVGLVPTMGWLHDGHRALMRRARDENATTVVTIFVNPRQFDDAVRLHALPPRHGGRPGPLRGRGRRHRRGSPASTRSTRPASTRPSAWAAWRRRWKVPRVPGTSTVSPRWSPSSSRWSAPSRPTSVRRTRSRSWSSAAWPATWRCPPGSSPAPPCAKPMVWRCRRATCT